MRAVRLFFALCPDDAVRDGFSRLAQALHQDCGGRLIRRENLHQTLVFLGNVAPDRISRLTALAADLRLGVFHIDFGVTGYWRRNRIVWAAPHDSPEALRALVSTLEQGVREAGFRCDQRSYASHVTLIRDAHPPVTLPPLRLDWSIRDFALVESARGARGPEYRVLARWPLRVSQA